jgi:hypothetical protein
MRMKTNDLHEQDFYAWTQQQAALLKENRLKEIDLENLIEEIESMGASEKRELYSRFKVLLLHLLKWEFQPEEQSHSWRSSIIEQTSQLEFLLEQSPSLKCLCEDALAYVYPKARRDAAEEAGLSPNSFPSACSYKIQEVLAYNFFPRKKQ